MKRIISTFEIVCEKLKNSKIVCWGAGNYFKAFLDSIGESISLDHIVYLVDQDAQKQSEGMDIKGHHFSVISREEFLRIWQKEVLVITTVYYAEILNWLEVEIPLQNKSYYIYPLLRHQDDWKQAQINRSPEALIPRIIHYCWFGNGQLPSLEETYIKGWKKLCPDYQYICWNEENFDVNSIPYTKWAYERKKWAYISDYVRMYALYKYGGFYFDTDVEMKKQIEPFRFQSGFWTMEETGCANSGSGIGMVAGNSLIRELLEEYAAISYEELEGRGKMPVNAERESDLLRRYGFLANNKYQVIEGTAIFPSSFFSPMLIGEKDICITDHTYAVHHFHLSWLKK